MSRDRFYRAVLVQRLGWLIGASYVALLVVAIGYWRVQVVGGGRYLKMAENNRLRKLAVEAPRGWIYDRNHKVLAENVPRYNLLFDRTLAADRDESIAFGASVLGVEPAEIKRRLDAVRGTPLFKPAIAAEGLDLEAVARFGVEQLEHPEFAVAVAHRRLYRHAHQTAHLLGYLGEVTTSDLRRFPARYATADLIGKKGVERFYDSRLRGSGGEQVVVVDSHGRWIEEFQGQPAVRGQPLELTLDLDLQQEAAELLEGKVGAIVAIDPRQGEVLALVSAPGFDPNRFAARIDAEEWQELLDHPNDPFQNRTLQNRYPPASVFKIAMAFAALDHGGIDPNEKVFCRGFSMIYNHRYRCGKPGGHGWVDLHSAIKHSCNVYFHQLGQRLGIDAIARYARRFGLDRRTGIDLIGERDGLVPDEAWSLDRRGTPWFPGETISVATGQGPILVTPLQIAVMMAAVANGGELVRPHLARNEPPPLLPVREPVLSDRSLDLIRRALWAVVNEPSGTGWRARIDGLDVVGKTGTAQVVTQATWTANRDLAPEQRDHAWFASYAPADDPRLVVVVFIEHGGAGSQAAAPLAKALYERFFDADLQHRAAS